MLIKMSATYAPCVYELNSIYSRLIGCDHNMACQLDLGSDYKCHLDLLLCLDPF